MSLNNSKVITIFKYTVGILCLTAIAAGLCEAWLQYSENEQIKTIADVLRTESVSSDIEAVADFVYQNAYISEGNYGLLRASALDVLNPKIGGQCGDFVRLSINILDQMGYKARRVYLFPAAREGMEFDPLNQTSFHVMAEILVDEKWIVVDSLRGITFRNIDGSFANMEELYRDPNVLAIALEEHPREVHTTIWGTVDEGNTEIFTEQYANPHRMNWGYLARIPGAFELTRTLLGEQLPNVDVPLILEQPHATMTASWSLLGLVLGGIYLSVRQLL